MHREEAHAPTAKTAQRKGCVSGWARPNSAPTKNKISSKERNPGHTCCFLSIDVGSEISLMRRSCFDASQISNHQASKPHDEGENRNCCSTYLRWGVMAVLDKPLFLSSLDCPVSGCDVSVRYWVSSSLCPGNPRGPFASSLVYEFRRWILSLGKLARCPCC
jgi:hypothetical protein